MNIVFAKPRHPYQSYSDFHRLVELAEFETCLIGEWDLGRDAVYIVCPANWELVQYLFTVYKKKRRARIVFWNLERPDGGPYELSQIEGTVNNTNSTREIFANVDEVWVSDRHFASLDARLTYVPLGSDRRLAEGFLPYIGRLHDVAILACSNSRRAPVYRALEERWLKVAPNSAWGEERDRILRASRSMVYVHQTELPIGAPLRFALAAAYKLPLICEGMADPYPLREGRDFLSCSLSEMPAKVESWLSGGKLPLIGENLHHTLCLEFPFRKCVEEAVARSFEMKTRVETR